MERLIQLIEKLKSEVEANAEREQMMETVFAIMRSLMVKNDLNKSVEYLSASIPTEQTQSVSTSSQRNENAQEGKLDLSERLSQQPIDSIRSAMGINEKYIFLQAFFKGEAHAFDKMMIELDDAKSYDDARLILEDYILAVPMNEEQAQALEKFDYLLRRRFLSI